MSKTTVNVQLTDEANWKAVTTAAPGDDVMNAVRLAALDYARLMPHGTMSVKRFRKQMNKSAVEIDRRYQMTAGMDARALEIFGDNWSCKDELEAWYRRIYGDPLYD